MRIIKSIKTVVFFMLPGSLWLTDVPALEVGSPAPSCEATLVGTGQTLDLARYRGKVVYLDFWATWCPPCKKSMPFLDSLSRQWKEKGLEVIAISVDTEPQEVERFLQRYPARITIALDPEGKCPEKYQVMAMPSSYLIDRSGRIRAARLGFHQSDEEEIRHLLVELLEE